MAVGICSKCGQERALMRSGLCGSCVRSAALNGAGPVQADLRSNALPVVQDNNVLVKKIDTLLSRVDDVGESVATVRDLVRGDSEDEDEDDEAPGEIVLPGESDEDGEDGDEDQPSPDDSGGASGFIIALFLVLFAALAIFLWLGGGLIKAARNRFLSDNSAQTTSRTMTESS